MSEVTEWLSVLTPLAMAIIPNFLKRDEISKKRAEKILEIIKPEIKNQIEEYHKNETLSEQELLKLFNCKKILNDAFLDLEAKDELKQKLLNFELNEILNGKTPYKHIYNNISTIDLEFLELIGTSWFSISSAFNFTYKPIIFIPTYSLLDYRNITLNNPFEREQNGMGSKHYFNIFKYNGDKQNILDMFDKYQSSIFNLISLGIITYIMEDNIIKSTDIEEFSSIDPFALSLTDKGKKIYKIIKK